MRPLGVKYRPVVSARPAPSLMRYTPCTSALPNVVSPTTSARSWSCIAPDTISEALALLRLTITIIGMSE